MPFALSQSCVMLVLCRSECLSESVCGGVKVFTSWLLYLSLYLSAFWSMFTRKGRPCFKSDNKTSSNKLVLVVRCSLDLRLFSPAVDWGGGLFHT